MASTGLTGPEGWGETSYQRGSEVHNCIHARSEIRISHVDLFFNVVINNQNYSCLPCLSLLGFGRNLQTDPRPDLWWNFYG